MNGEEGSLFISIRIFLLLVNFYKIGTKCSHVVKPDKSYNLYRPLTMQSHAGSVRQISFSLFH